MLCMFIRLQFGFTHRPGHSPSQVYYLCNLFGYLPDFLPPPIIYSQVSVKKPSWLKDLPREMNHLQ